MNHRKIVLASASPRRKQLLEWAEIPFEIIVHPSDESFPVGMHFIQAAEFIAFQKAKAVSLVVGGNPIILAADTIVVLDNEIIGKPKDAIEAFQMLNCIQGRTHQVVTAVAIMNQFKQQLFSEITEVSFNPLSSDQIQFYIDNYKPFDKAGAYGIQEWIGVVGIKSINGDFYNVMGLPVSRVVQELQSF